MRDRGGGSPVREGQYGWEGGRMTTAGGHTIVRGAGEKGRETRVGRSGRAKKWEEKLCRIEVPGGEGGRSGEAERGRTIDDEKDAVGRRRGTGQERAVREVEGEVDWAGREHTWPST